MRSLATLIAGGPARVAVTTVGIVATGFVASGYGDALLRSLFVTFVAASAGLLIALSLLFLAAALGSTAMARSPSPSRGRPIMAKREPAPRLRVSVKEGARDATTGRVAFRMISVEANGEAGINAAVGLLDAVMGVLDRPKQKEIGRG